MALASKTWQKGGVTFCIQHLRGPVPHSVGRGLGGTLKPVSPPKRKDEVPKHARSPGVHSSIALTASQ